MNLPIDFQNQMKEMLGEAYDAFLSEYDKPYFSALRCNIRKISRDELCKLLCKQSCKNDLVPWEQNGIYYDDFSGDKGNTAADRESPPGPFRPGKSPFHEAGLYYIQEPSAMLPVTELSVDASGMKVLDLCAAPGGKTTQIADYMQGKGLLIANEIVPLRAKILSENIERMGAKNAIVISADPHELVGRFEGFFDRILVDAPCSGEGMFRKHPEAMEEWSLENVRVCAERQAWILDCAIRMLKPGGKMLYSTCTFNKEEDEGTVKAFLERHPEVDITKESRIFPHTHKGEGHFAAAFVKNIPAAESGTVRFLTESPARKDEVRPFLDFAQEALTENARKKLTDDGGIFIAFGDQLYLSPKDTPSLKGLKVLRPGLHLGTIKKGRFEPSHALALYLNKEDVKETHDFPEGEGDAIRYLKGETLATDKKGWTLVTVCGYSLGWGKASNGILKNHYPKGLRWA